MKNIFIGGVARSGKSTIAEKITKMGPFNHIPVDYFASSFNENFPVCGINNDVIVNNGSINLSLFLSTVIEYIDREDEKFVLDSAHVMPRDIIKYLNKEKWDIYFVGYTNIEPEVKFDCIRKFEKKTDWTRNFSDHKMLELTKSLIELSKKIEKECKDNDIVFIDTSTNFKKVIERFVEGIN